MIALPLHEPDSVSGLFQSEISLPVIVHYTVDEGGRVELSQVTLAPEALRAFAGAPTLLWPELPPSESRALRDEAESEARRWESKEGEAGTCAVERGESAGAAGLLRADLVTQAESQNERTTCNNSEKKLNLAKSGLWRPV